ncbi:hypothetical protein SLEP1_g42522 [Rubroshorea leprosula]|uniref:Nucleolar complex protein 2 homolog n=1 Tax=Rubroshorea leprosula TaxID=152421 RepID=A0AAV5LB13_9ROSI|nr:hypothetical protein SLEP1_g42522 [Rubroshorea leprosula]
MGKLGKKARKFARKNLQSVMKRKRKLNSMFKKKSQKSDEQDEVENQEEVNVKQSNARNTEGEGIEDASLDDLFSDESDAVGDDSESDGYLSEGSNCTYMDEDKFESHLEDADSNLGSDLSVQNREIHLELMEKMKMLDRLKEKDPAFSKFLESYENRLKPLRNNEDYSDEDDTSSEDMASEGDVNLSESKVLTHAAFDSLCQLVKEQQSISAFTSLLNGYRAACHYGNEPLGVLDVNTFCRIQDSNTFCKILTFVLREADNILKGMLGISCSSCRKETILELKNKSKWKTLKPLVKSFLRSTLFLLNQVTDSEILAFALVRIRASVIFFAAFPSLLHRLIKTAVHLWATGEGILASHSFLIIKEVASVFSSDCFELCWIKIYKAFLGHCKFGDPVSSKHLQFLRSSFVELCSQDMQISSSKAMVSIQRLAKILQLGLRTKKKEAVKKICSWHYMNCVDLWVSFISLNVRDYDIQPLPYMIIQIINGMALLFPGPRYFPLRRKCIQWLNDLSSSSGIFIPISSFALDVLEYKTGKDGRKAVKEFNVSSIVKLPKHLLKSRNFPQECVSSAIELLAMHFAQWSYQISFPELATIPLIRLRKFHETTTVESFRRVVKRFIDQVEQNIEFVRKKRDEVAFSPKDQQSVETFLQLEKPSGNAPFTQYYKSIIEKAISRNLITNEKASFLNQKSKATKRRQLPNSTAHVDNGKEFSEERNLDMLVVNGDVNREKKQKT